MVKRNALVKDSEQSQGRARVLERLLQEVRPEEGRLPAWIFTQPELYQLEVERIFQRVWLFVAHESEVPEPGDYVSRELAGQSVIVARGEDGRVRVMLNLCRHRGMRVCRAELGNASHFRCPYHGFTYTNAGDLVGVPFQREVFGDSLDKSELSLVQARTETYGGLIFASWAADPQPLEDYLGAMRWYLDLWVRRAEMEVCGPPQRWVVAANWKIAAENFMSDAYHTAHSHGSITKIGMVPSVDLFKGGYQIYAGNGHGLTLGLPSPRFIFAPELLPSFERSLDAAQVSILKQLANMPGTVFPNLSFLISSLRFKGEVVSHTTMRLWLPKGPDRMEVLSWLLIERGAPERWRELSRQAYIVTFGTSGMFEQDDTENWTDITDNCRGPIADRLSFIYDAGRERPRVYDFPGPGEVYEGKFSEANARAFYRHWLNLLLGAA